MTNKLYPSPIETKRLLLQPTGIQDAAFIFALMNTPDWHKFIGDRNVHSEKDAVAYIKKYVLPQYEKLGFTSNTVIHKKTGEKLGTCGLYDRPGLIGVDLGFAFLPQHYRKGFGYESAKAILDASRKLYKLSQVNAITSPVNVASQKLLLKLGFEYIDNRKLEGSNDILQFYTFSHSD